MPNQSRPMFDLQQLGREAQTPRPAFPQRRANPSRDEIAEGWSSDPDHLERQIHDGKVQSINPATAPVATPAPPPPLGRPAKPVKIRIEGDPREASAEGRCEEEDLSTYVPTYVMRELRKRSIDGDSIRVQILRALRGQGIFVRDADMVDDRRKSRNRR